MTCGGTQWSDSYYRVITTRLAWQQRCSRVRQAFLLTQVVTESDLIRRHSMAFRALVGVLQLELSSPITKWKQILPFGRCSARCCAQLTRQKHCASKSMKGREVKLLWLFPHSPQASSVLAVQSNLRRSEQNRASEAPSPPQHCELVPQKAVPSGDTMQHTGKWRTALLCQSLLFHLPGFIFLFLLVSEHSAICLKQIFLLWKGTGFVSE